tara:strand:- start:202 stop:327 length:126 start_codon:yes stop_codon:yes gene_type:complete
MFVFISESSKPVMKGSRIESIEKSKKKNIKSYCGGRMEKNL